VPRSIAHQSELWCEMPGGAENRRMSKNRRRWRYLLALLLAAGLLWVASALRQRRRDRSAVAEIETETNNGRFEIAARKLSELLPRRPVSDQAAYLLGTCEKARGRYQAATEAWARVTPGSEFSYQAAQARVRLAEDNGRFADAERLVNEAVQDPRSERTELLVMLVPLFSQPGRLDEAERLVEARWEHLKVIGEEASERAIFQLQARIFR
jgi:tetratricopeptide (TPR) repeat protein